MRRWMALAVALAVAIAGILYFRSVRVAENVAAGNPSQASEKKSASQSAASPPAPVSPVAPANAAQSPGAVGGNNMGKTGSPTASLPVPTVLPGALQFTNIPPEMVVREMGAAIHSYASMFRQNPVGDNLSITAALNGKNPRQANFIKPDAGMRINADGELIDPWGTPYFFHALSAHDMEIHSAGPDRKMWTDDDIVAR